MDCALWLNRRKIFSADEISANFDIAAIRGYFLGGSLAVWLSSHGGEEYSRAVSQLDPSDPRLNDRLTEIFTGKGCDVPVHKADEALIRAVDEFRGVPSAPASGSLGTGPFNGEYGSFGALGSYMYGYGSYNYGSFAGGSFGYGSRSWAWDWEWEWRFGSFRKAQSSFNLGSFSYGSFNYGSFSRGSFRLWEWEWEWRFGSFGALGSYMYGYGSFNYGSFGGSFRFPSGLFGGESGSFRGTAGSFVMLTPDEYDEIMYRTLGMCPLNRFGYGIHLI